MEKKLSRRNFLKTGCVTAAAVGITVCGGTAIANTVTQPTINKPSFKYGDNSMENKKVLVTYATKAGTTAEIASKIGEILSQQNVTVDVLPIKQAADINQYSAIVMGSAIRIGNILPEAKKFIEENQTLLKEKSFSVFIACMTLHEDTEENRKTVHAYLDPVRELIQPVNEGLFAGCVDLSKVGLLDRMMIKAVKSPVGDFRDWNKIQNWAENLNITL
jgi:menaquinone-dependent protoporphyrinogen oxidase